MDLVTKISTNVIRSETEMSFDTQYRYVYSKYSHIDDKYQ